MKIYFLFLITILISCNNMTGNNPESNIANENDTGYKLYVQFKNKKGLKENSEVKMKDTIVGKVIGLEKNPDAYIVKLLIFEGIEIPILSKFTISSESNDSNFIHIEPSDDKRLLRANEYFSGVE